MADVEFFREQNWYFAVKPCKIPVGRWLAWAAQQPLTHDSPMKEPLDRIVVFEFGENRESAITKLKCEVFSEDEDL